MLGGYRPEGPAIGKLTDSQGNCYTSLPAAVNKYFGMKSLYEDCLKKYHNSKFSKELKSLSDTHNMSLYSVVEDALGYNNDVEASIIVKNLKAGSSRNFLNPYKACRHLLKFISVKLKAFQYR